MPDAYQVEMKAETTHGLLTASEPTGIGHVMKGENFSSFRRLISVTSHVLKFCHILLSKVRPDMTTTTSDDLAKAEAFWLVESQQALVRDKNFAQWKKQFGLFQDD